MYKENVKTINRIPKMYNENPGIADEIFSPQCIHHVNGTREADQGPELVKKAIGMIEEQFTNSQTTFIDVIAEKNLVAVRWTWEAVNRLSQKKWMFNGNTIFRLEGGKIVEYWAIDDRFREMFDHGFTLHPPK